MTVRHARAGIGEAACQPDKDPAMCELPKPAKIPAEDGLERAARKLLGARGRRIRPAERLLS